MNNSETMTRTFVRHTGKLLFPNLARDQRKRLMHNILLVLTACLISAGGLSVWMMSAGVSAGHVIMIPNIFLGQK